MQADPLPSAGEVISPVPGNDPGRRIRPESEAASAPPAAALSCGLGHGFLEAGRWACSNFLFTLAFAFTLRTLDVHSEDFVNLIISNRKRRSVHCTWFWALHLHAAIVKRVVI